MAARAFFCVNLSSESGDGRKLEPEARAVPLRGPATGILKFECNPKATHLQLETGPFKTLPTVSTTTK